MSLPACPTCGSTEVAVIARGEAVCQDCGAAFSLSPTSCPSCGHVNFSEAESCAACGEPLSLAARVVDRQLSAPSPRRLDQVRAQAPALKAEAEKASQARMAVFQRAERLREEQVRRMSASRAEEDRRILLAAAAIAVVVILALLAAVAAAL